MRSKKGNIQGEIVAVISDNHHAKALDIARDAGIEAIFGNAKSEEYPQWLLGTVQSYEPDYVLLAGYMRIVPPEFVSAFPQRIINIHPALLPSFPDFTGNGKPWNTALKFQAALSITWMKEWILERSLRREQYRFWKEIRKKLFPRES